MYLDLRKEKEKFCKIQHVSRTIYTDAFAELEQNKRVDLDNNRQIHSRSSADQNWQWRRASYNVHKALDDGNREIGKPNMVSCHHPSLPPSVSQQMLCSMKTLSAAQEWAQNLSTMTADKKKEKKEEKQNTHTHKEAFSKSASRVNNNHTAPRRRAPSKCMHRPLSRNRTYRYGNTPLPLLLPLPTTITIVYTYTHTLVSCSPGAV